MREEDENYAASDIWAAQHLKLFVSRVHAMLHGIGNRYAAVPLHSYHGETNKRCGAADHQREIHIMCKRVI